MGGTGAVVDRRDEAAPAQMPSMPPMSRFVSYFIRLLGFDSKNSPGQVDHGKLWSTVIIVWVMTFITIVDPAKFSIGVVIVIVSASFGRAMFGRFLESKAVQAREVTKNVNKIVDIEIDKKIEQTMTINAPRDYEEGVQPWGGPDDDGTEE